TWLLPSPDFDESKKYPLILEIHGGPHAMYGNTFYHELQVYAAGGYLVLYCNPRGSTGAGQQFVNAAAGDWGGCDYRDLMDVVDHVSKFRYVDTSRMGVTGGSYGGYMTNWIITQTDRFKAAVTQRSTVNRHNLYGTSDLVWSYASWEFGGSAYERPDFYLERSPLTYIKNVSAPVLIMHSENDFRCPVEQSEQLFVALKLHGKTTEYIRFPNESHGLSRTGRPDHRVERLDRAAEWFDRYL
ncbi:MAG: S9 family peptidase, partial [Nitrolancea sp.]